MTEAVAMNRRVLVIDDNPAILEDYRKVLCSLKEAASVHTDRESIFDDIIGVQNREPFVVDCADQGSVGCDLVQQAVKQDSPYAVAFVDMRMPPGWDGVETIERMWAIDPAIQTVICTAFSDHEWDEVIPRLGHRDQLLILRKPFDPIEVQQLANALTYKWHWASHGTTSS